MIFAHDTEVSLAAAAALVNSSPEADRPDGDGLERLPDPAALTEFMKTWGWTGSHVGDERELEQGLALRPRLARVWEADEDEAVEIVNGLLREGGSLPQLVQHDS